LRFLRVRALIIERNQWGANIRWYFQKFLSKKFPQQIKTFTRGKSFGNHPRILFGGVFDIL
jgi:hypothetical protein